MNMVNPLFVNDIFDIFLYKLLMNEEKNKKRYLKIVVINVH